jgi:hypothetical protein
MATLKTSFAELIGTWPRAEGQTSIATFAADIGVAYYHAQMMRYRSSVNADFWPSVIRAGKRRGVEVTHDELARMRERRKRVGRPRQRVEARLATG